MVLFQVQSIHCRGSKLDSAGLSNLKLVVNRGRLLLHNLYTPEQFMPLAKLIANVCKAAVFVHSSLNRRTKKSTLIQKVSREFDFKTFYMKVKFQKFPKIYCSFVSNHVLGLLYHSISRLISKKTLK